ncbi:MAG: AAA family ATPase [Acetatifactor muris]|nr:AAA family ATPase [Acetatifactor muris]
MEIKSEMTYEEAVAALREYINSTGKKQVDVAAELGLSGALVSSFLSGSYKTPHAVIPKIAELIKANEKKKVSPKKPEFTETSVSRTVFNAISYAHLRGTVAVVYGDAGVGKTCAIREYVKKNRLALAITVSPTYASITGVNELIAEQLGVRERVARRITKEIVQKLKNSGRVLIVDEAQHLTVRALNHLRCISDESGVGTALIGNEEVYDKLRGIGRTGGKERADFAQLFSRIGMRKEVLANRLTDEDITGVFGAYGLEQDAVGMLAAVARTNYGLRGAVNVFINAAAVFGKVDKAGIVKVMRDMNIG